MKRVAAAALSIFCAISVTSALAVQDCEMNGQHVNPANGSTTAGKTGIMKCRDRDSGKLVREEEYRNGRPIGYRKSIDFSGNTIVANFNEQGNRDGESKTYDAGGMLIADERYSNSNHVGLQTYYHKNQQLRRRAYYQDGQARSAAASIEYNDRGQLADLRCAEKPLLGDDRALCGFDGRPSEVTFYSATGDVTVKARFENGKRVAFTTYVAPGVVARTEEIQGERRLQRLHFTDGPVRLETVIRGNQRESEREFAKSGQPVRDTRWQEAGQSEETLWYLNGQLRSKTRWERDGGQVLVKAEEYWDNGKLKARTVRDQRRGFVGLQQAYDESGALASETTYEKGALMRRKNYKDGRLVLDEEYFEDGSRKSARKE